MSPALAIAQVTSSSAGNQAAAPAVAGADDAFGQVLRSIQNVVSDIGIDQKSVAPSSDGAPRSKAGLLSEQPMSLLRRPSALSDLQNRTASAQASNDYVRTSGQERPPLAGAALLTTSVPASPAPVQTDPTQTDPIQTDPATIAHGLAVASVTPSRVATSGNGGTAHPPHASAAAALTSPAAATIPSWALAPTAKTGATYTVPIPAASGLTVLTAATTNAPTPGHVDLTAAVDTSAGPTHIPIVAVQTATLKRASSRIRPIDANPAGGVSISSVPTATTANIASSVAFDQLYQVKVDDTTAGPASGLPTSTSTASGMTMSATPTGGALPAASLANVGAIGVDTGAAGATDILAAPAPVPTSAASVDLVAPLVAPLSATPTQSGPATLVKDVAPSGINISDTPPAAYLPSAFAAPAAAVPVFPAATSAIVNHTDIAAVPASAAIAPTSDLSAVVTPKAATARVLPAITMAQAHADDAANSSVTSAYFAPAFAEALVPAAVATVSPTATLVNASSINNASPTSLVDGSATAAIDHLASRFVAAPAPPSVLPSPPSAHVDFGGVATISAAPLAPVNPAPTLAATPVSSFVQSSAESAPVTPAAAMVTSAEPTTSVNFASAFAGPAPVANMLPVTAAENVDRAGAATISAAPLSPVTPASASATSADAVSAAAVRPTGATNITIAPSLASSAPAFVGATTVVQELPAAASDNFNAASATTISAAPTPAIDSAPALAAPAAAANVGPAATPANVPPVNAASISTAPLAGSSAPASAVPPAPANAAPAFVAPVISADALPAATPAPVTPASALNTAAGVLPASSAPALATATATANVLPSTASGKVDTAAATVVSAVPPAPAYFAPTIAPSMAANVLPSTASGNVRPSNALNLSPAVAYAARAYAAFASTGFEPARFDTAAPPVTASTMTLPVADVSADPMQAVNLAAVAMDQSAAPAQATSSRGRLATAATAMPPATTPSFDGAKQDVTSSVAPKPAVSESAPLGVATSITAGQPGQAVISHAPLSDLQSFIVQPAGVGATQQPAPVAVGSALSATDRKAAPDSFNTTNTAAPVVASVPLPEQSAIPVALPVTSDATAATPAVPAHGTDAPSPATQIAPTFVTLAKTTDGNQQMTVRLHPADLGMVQVRIERTSSGATQVELTTDKPDTLQALQRDQSGLNHALDEAGIPAAGRLITFHIAQPAPSSLGSGGADLASGQHAGAGGPNHNSADFGGSSGGGKGGYPAREANRWSTSQLSSGSSERSGTSPGVNPPNHRVGLDITA